MIERYTLQFLLGIKQNNNKPWFEKNRKSYESSKQNVLELSSELIKQISIFDPPVANVAAKDTLFRINRDIRFSKNKLPYKTNMAVYINPEGKKSDSPGYYLHIEPGKSFIAAGVWMPEPNVLGKIRQEIDYNLKEWEKITGKKPLIQSFPNGLSKEDALSRPPKGYSAENAAIEFLRLKSFIVVRLVNDKELTQKQLIKELSTHFKNAKPLIDFLRTAISE